MSPFLATQEWANGAGLKHLAFTTTTSSNDEAKSRPAGEVDLVIVRYQTHGRGRGDHSWQAAADEALLSSWCLQLPVIPQPVFSVRVGLALYRAASETWPTTKLALKAPNDLHVISRTETPSQGPAAIENESATDAMKLAGLLIEIITTPKSGSQVIVGLGLNVLGSPEGTKPFRSTCLLKAKMDLTQWSKFLTHWHSGLQAAAARADQLTLTGHERSYAYQALRNHPLYSELKSVAEDGSLLQKNGSVTPWFLI